MKRYILNQTQLERIRELCEAGTRRSGDERFYKIMCILSEMPELAASGPTIG